MAVPLPELPGVEHGEVHVRGVRLHVATAGSGPPLLLLHGWPQHWWSWRRLISRLTDRFSVIVPDLRGWGWSEAPPGAYDKPTFAQDMLALLDHAGLERVKIIAHDWGGYTAFLLALEHPERVERMVCLDIVPPWPTPPRLHHLRLPLFLSYQFLLASPLGVPAMTRGPGFVRGIIRAGSGREMSWSDEELDVYARVLSEPARARASSACYRTFLTREVPGALRRRYRPDQLRVPTLLLMGGSSALRRALDPQPGPNLEVQSISRAGHFLPEEAPDAVLERALPFLAAPDSRGRAAGSETV